MTRILVASVCLHAAAVASLASEGMELRITIALPAQEYVVGEPVIATQVWKNQTEVPIKVYYRAGVQSDAVEVRSTGERKQCGITDSVKMVECTHEMIGPGEEVRRPLSISDLGYVDDGDYEIWVVYDGTKLPGSCGWYRQRVESNRVRFRIEKPRGVNAEVFAKFQQPDLALGPGHTVPGCNRVVLTPDALKQYPTSTYVAYALFAAGRPGYASPEAEPPDASAEEEFMLLQRMLDRRLNMPGVRPEEKPTYQRHHDVDMKKERGIIDALERLASTFPTFPYRPQALYGLVRAYFRAGEPEKAVPIVKELVEKHPSSDVARKVGSYKAVLEAHSLWPATGTPGPAPR